MTDIQLAALKVSMISPDSSADVIAEVSIALDGMAQRIEELQEELKGRLMEKIRETGEFKVGSYLYTIGKDKKVTGRSMEAIVQAILETTGGDVKRFCDCLSANAFKHGAIKRMLDELGAPPETFDTLFQTTYDDKLKLKKINLEFVK